MSKFYSTTTGGFYDTEVHSSLFICDENVTDDPETGETVDRWCECRPDPAGPIADAVDVTDEDHASLLAGQANGQRIISDDSGHPVLADHEPPTTERLAEIARAERNRLLSASDWTQLPDAPIDQAAWTEYRQALRDLPSQAGFPADITWPIAP